MHKVISVDFLFQSKARDCYNIENSVSIICDMVCKLLTFFSTANSKKKCNHFFFN